jgi:hypothetical protein
VGILRSPEYGETVKAVVRSATTELAIVSSFATRAAAEAVFGFVSPTVRRKELHVRWCPDDLLYGVSDLAVYELAKEHGFAMFMQPALHAKFVIADRKHIVLGSANMTGRGLGLFSEANAEAGIVVEPEACEIELLEEIMRNSTLITPDLFDRMRSYVEKNRIPVQVTREFPADIASILNDQFTGLWVRDLPLQLLPPSKGGDRISAWDIELEKNFSKAKCMRWLMGVLQLSDHAIYFGELTSSLHDTLLEDPTPYRTEVKKLAANLINWCVTLLPDQFGCDTPNYSQRLYLKHSAESVH